MSRIAKSFIKARKSFYPHREHRIKRNRRRKNKLMKFFKSKKEKLKLKDLEL